MFTKNNFKQRISILEDGASGWHWKDNCQKIVQNIITLHEIYESSKKNYYDLTIGVESILKSTLYKC